MAFYKNTAAQKIAVFAYNKATGVAKTGDAANITAHLSKDWGSPAAITDTNPTELDATNMPGWYLFDLLQTETNAEVLIIAPKSVTADIILDQMQIVTENLAANHTGTVGSVTGAVGSVAAGVTVTTNSDKSNYTLSTAGVQAIWDALSSALTTANSIGKRIADALNGHIPQTGDSFARIGAAGAGLTVLGDTRMANLDAAMSTRATPAQVNTEAQSVIVANNLDHLAKVAAVAGDVVDNSIIARMTSKSATPAFTSFDNTTDSLEAIRDNASGAGLDAAGVRAAVGLASANLDTQLADLPTVAEFNARTQPTADYFDPATDTVANVTTVGTVTNPVTAGTVSDKTGYALSVAGIQAIWNALTSALSTVNCIGKRIVDNLDAAVTSRMATFTYTAPPTAVQNRQEMDSNSTRLATIQNKTDRLPSDPAGETSLLAALSTIVGYLDTEVAAIKAKTDLLPGAPAAKSDIPSAAANADAVLDELLSSHTVAGSVGAALSAAGSAGNPWSVTDLGDYDAGTAGYILNAAGSAGNPWSVTDLGDYDADTAGYLLNWIRTRLLSIATSLSEATDGGTMTIHRGDTFVKSWTGLGDLSGRRKLWLTGKKSVGFVDAASVFQVEETDGLLYLNGAVAAAEEGSLVVDDEDEGNVTCTLTAVSTATLPRLRAGVFDIQMALDDVNNTITTLAIGVLNVEADVTRAVD